MATKPKRGLNTLELRLCMFGAAQTLWSYARACLVLLKRFGATPVHVRRSTGHQSMQKQSEITPSHQDLKCDEQGLKPARSRPRSTKHAQA